jgi:hypothetical protein
VLNPGSVGLQALALEEPHPHAISAGSPHARYALLHREDGRWRVETRLVRYPWRDAALAAEAAGRGDWVCALLTGRA